MSKNIKEIILDQLSKKREIKVSDVIKVTGFSRAFINRFFQELKKEGKISLIGKANKAYYVLASNESRAKKDILFVKRIIKNENLLEDEVLEEIKNNSGIFSKLPKNIANIVEYAFTEMLNNAIEHSKSKEITVLMNREKDLISFEVADHGIGILKNIMSKRNLSNEMEAIQDLLKGKQTTDPQRHSGEGIFFTSKIADNFSVQGSAKKIIFNNIVKDYFIKDVAEMKGTKVIFSVSVKSKKELGDIFKEFSGEAFGFNKTKVKVNLFEIDDSYVSRSQARRVLAGLDKFKDIILDFKNIESIGQGFADEVFRIWPKSHPGKKIEYENTNENILFMIKRAKEGD
jgi:anti-sigma regulatory factor (Ser/Thr protein kinase)